MELRRYVSLLRRRWLVALLPAAIVLLAGLFTYRAPPTAYNVGVRFLVGQEPGEEAGVADEQRYYNWLASEYIVNGLTDWVRGGGFAAAVSRHLAGQGYDIPAQAIQGGLAADNARSMLTLSLSHGDPEALALMMESAIAVLANENAQALPQLGGEGAILTQLDQPVVNATPAGIRSQLNLPLRIALALFVGAGLAFLAEYLDPTFRDREDLEALSVPILGEIPKE